MNTITFLEQLAKNTFYHPELSTLLYNQSPEIQHAFFQNNAEALKNKFSNIEYLANGVAVIET